MVEGWRCGSSSIALSAFQVLTEMSSGLTSVTPKFRSEGQGSRDRIHLCGLCRTINACNRAKKNLLDNALDDLEQKPPIQLEARPETVSYKGKVWSMLALKLEKGVGSEISLS